MLPNHHAGTYELYKADTDVIADWLANTARQCGYKSNLPKAQNTEPPRQGQGPRLKGKARKLAKDAAAAAAKSEETTKRSLPLYVVAVKDFIILAGKIAAHKQQPVKVPHEIVKSLNRAIALRKEHALWFQAAKSADDGHEFFIGILEQVRTILSACMPSGPTSNREPLQKIKVSTDKRGHIGNIFKHLNLEEPSEAFLNAPSATTTSKPTALSTAHYRAERLQTDEEQALAAHCLLNDIKNIRASIKKLWAHYCAGEIDLHVAAVTTNAAIEMICSKEKDYQETFSHDSDFLDLLESLYMRQCSHFDADPAKPDLKIDFDMDMYEFADEIMLPTYTSLALICRVEVPSVSIFCHVTGEHDPSVPWSGKSAHERLLHDRLALRQAMPELIILAATEPIAADELIRAVRGMRIGKNPSLWLTFAFQVFLDVQHVLGTGTVEAFKELQQESRCMTETIERCLDFHKALRVSGWTTQDDKNLRLVQETIHSFVENDSMGDLSEQAQAMIGAKAERPTENALLKRSPVLCGTWLFKMRYHLQVLGVNYTRAWGSLVPCAHLYNAMRQEKLLTGSWKNMELAMALHKVDSIFIGDPPSKPKDYVNRYQLSLGISPTVFAQNKRSSSNQRFSRKKSRNITSSHLPYSNILASGYFDRRSSLASDLSGAEKLMARFRNPRERSGHRAFDNDKTLNLLSPIGQDGLFLESVAVALQKEVPALKFDYFTFHRTCWAVLSAVHDTLRQSVPLLNEFGVDYLERESQLPYIVGYLLMIAFPSRREYGEVSVPAQLKMRLLSEVVKAMQNVILSSQA